MIKLFPFRKFSHRLQLTSAYLLVHHGSRDPRPQMEVEKLAHLISQKWRYCQLQPLGSRKSGVSVANAIGPLVGTACLELAPLPFHQQIEQFGQKMLASGYNYLQILPLFLLPGVHVVEDIPAEVAIAQKALGSDLQIEIAPHLGQHPGIARLFAKPIANWEVDGCILISHGSRREGANQPVEMLATELKALPAYWSVSPKLEFQLQRLLMAGYRRIGILPYFLFGGAITDAIAQSVAQIKQEFPAANYYLAAPLGASVELADLILDLVRE